MTPLELAALDDAVNLLLDKPKIDSAKYTICKSYLLQLVLDLHTDKNRQKAVKAVNVYKEIFVYPDPIFDNKKTRECEMLTIGVNSGGGGSQKAKKKTQCGSQKAKKKHAVKKTSSNKPYI